MIESTDAHDPIAAFENGVIPHTNHMRALEAIAALHSRYRPLARGGLTARALLIAGATGSGKSTGLRDYQSRFPDITPENVDKFPEYAERVKDGDIRRVVYVEVPERATRRSIVAAILAEFGENARKTSSASDLIGRIQFYTNEHLTEILLLDEGHHIVNEKNPDSTREITEFIKSLLNRLKVQIVIAGEPSLLVAMSIDGKASQLQRRLQPPVNLRPYDWRTKVGRVQFSAILKSLEASMRLPHPSHLSAHGIAKRLFVASGGEIGIVSKYLSEALRIALREGRTSVDLALLARVHESWWDDEVEAADIIDFDAILPGDGGAGQTSRQNPFSCADADLRDLWMQRRAPLPDASRPTGSRAKGSGPVNPFRRAS